MRPEARPASRVPGASAPREEPKRCTVERPVTWSVNVWLIEQKRVLRGWTRGDLARAAHVDSKTLRDMIGRRRRPTFGTVQALCAVLGVTLPEVIIFGHDGEEWRSLPDSRPSTDSP